MWTAPQVLDYSALRRTVCGLRDTYDCLTVNAVGRSREGRALFSLSLGRGEHSVLFCGGFHGSEWVSAWLLLRFAETLCRSVSRGEPCCGADVASFLRRRTVRIVPCVNPDGTEIFLHGAEAARSRRALVESVWQPDVPWNANAAGVDINHNFDAGWSRLRQAERRAGITGPAPRQYGGPAPESEPETRAVCDLCRRLQPAHLLAIHSQGEEIFWKYGREDPPRAKMLLAVFADASGYTPVRNAGLYAHGGCKDWFIRTFRRPAFTVEVGKGKNPLPTSDFEAIWDKTREMLTLAAVL